MAEITNAAVKSPATLSPEGEVEGMVELLIDCAWACGAFSATAPKEAQKGNKDQLEQARTALLSRISPSPVNTSGRDPDGSGLSQVDPLRVSPADAASIPSASTLASLLKHEMARAEEFGFQRSTIWLSREQTNLICNALRKTLWDEAAVQPRALRLSIEELDRAEGLCLHELKDEVSYLESVDLVLHEVKRLRWRPIETAPKARDADGQLQQALLIGRYPSNGHCTDIVQGWWCDGFRGEEGYWERWRHAFPPSHWMPVPAPPAPGGETRRAETAQAGSVHEHPVAEGQAPDLVSYSPDRPAPSLKSEGRS